MPKRFAGPAFALLVFTGVQLFLGCNRHPGAAAQAKEPEKDEAKSLGLTAETFRYPSVQTKTTLPGWMALRCRKRFSIGVSRTR